MIAGFIGLGTMGAPMARNLLAKGHQLVVCDVVPQSVAALTAAGARAAATPREVAAAADFVITMLPDSPDVERVALGPDGIVAGHPAGRGLHRHEHDRSGDDAPRRREDPRERRGDDRQSGRQDRRCGRRRHADADGRRPTPTSIARCRPLLDCMGTDFFHCGELGAGQTMKLLNNLLAQALGAASTEALVAGVKAGLTLDTMMSVLRTTMAWNNQLAIGMPKRPLVGDFAPGFMMKLAHKDCRLALQMVDALGVVAPVGHATLASLDEGIRHGLKDMDVGAMLKMREEQAGVTVRLPKT